MTVRKIHKYKLKLVDEPQTILMPAMSLIRFVGRQNDDVTMWAEVRTDYPVDVARKFVVVGTGQPIPDGGTYVGTCFGVPFVWHIFEVSP